MKYLNIFREIQNEFKTAIDLDDIYIRNGYLYVSFKAEGDTRFYWTAEINLETGEIDITGSGTWK